ncbi:MAG: Hsp20/alpha crystallin family protein [Bacteroidetes bacterium]|nr:MAG: Hsp20/alpha crystallin family protein [Bacteroidota bacterium]
MNVIKWKPKMRLPKVVEKFFGKRLNDGTSNGTQYVTVPSVNISEADKAFEVSIALPGLSKKDVQVKVEDGYLTIASEKDHKWEEKGKNWIRQEYNYAAFQRTFELPEYADPDKVEARMKDGVLNIRIGKKKGYLPAAREIRVN